MLPVTPDLISSWTGNPVPRQAASGGLSTLQLARSRLSMSKGMRRPRQTGTDQEERRGPGQRPRGSRRGSLSGPIQGVPAPHTGRWAGIQMHNQRKRLSCPAGSPRSAAWCDQGDGDSQTLQVPTPQGQPARPLCKTMLRTQAKKRSVCSLVVLSCLNEESCDARPWSGTTGPALSSGGIKHFLLSLNLEAQKVKSVLQSCAGSHCSPHRPLQTPARTQPQGSFW